MSPEAQSTLHEIVTIARDGREFYEYAEMVVADESLREPFSRMAQAKSDVVALVASRLNAIDEPEPSRREFRRDIRAALTRLRGLLLAEDSAELLGGLGDIEERLIYHYTWVLAGSGDEATRRELGNLLPVLQRCRDELIGAGGWDSGAHRLPGQKEGPASADPSFTQERKS